MKIITIALALLLAPFLLIAPAHAADTAEPTRIMVVGDSVTHGLSGQYTWRYFSHKGLQKTGATVDFVGPHVGTYSDDGWFAGTYADPNFDQDHAARWGLTLWETLFFPSGENTPSVEDLMESDPDVIVEALGVNDLTILNQTPEELARYVGEFVGKARAVNPGVDVVVMALPQVWYERVPVYNALLPGIAADLSTPESRVVVTPVAQFTNGVDTTDDAHPTTLGMRKIAAAVSAGLEELGLGHEVLMPEPDTSTPPPVVEPTATPTPTATPEPVVETPAVASVPSAPTVARPDVPRRVRAVREGRRTTVTWRTGVGATSYAVRCGSTERSTVTREATMRSDASRCKVRAVNSMGSSPWAVVRVRR